jgi:Na+-transporting NADH:ubiquinone oxidoreductase subunit NqrB
MHPAPSTLRLPADPRWYQIAVLSALLAYGVLGLGFDLGPAQIAVTLGAAQLAQWAGTRLGRLPRFDPLSALISSLSLCLLLRTDHLGVAAIASAIAVGSKFLVRVRGKHVFNPTNLALVVVAASGSGWVSPGQWGNVATFGFLMACLGSVVVVRAARADVTFAFLAAYAAILFGRALWLGQPFSIPLHQLSGGALLLFAFFMISDPKTTPDSRPGRLLFAGLVASGAAFVTFALHRPNGLLWSLAAWSAAVPLIDRWWPGARYDWTHPAARTLTPAKGDLRATIPLPAPAAPAPAGAVRAATR